MGDAQLCRDEELSRALYREHADALLSYVQRLMHGDRQLAEDIVQETLLRAWTHADRVPADAQRPWLFITARHLVIDAYRSRNARPAEASTDLDGAVAAVTHDELDAALDAVLLTDALHALSAEHRRILFDCYYPPSSRKADHDEAPGRQDTGRSQGQTALHLLLRPRRRQGGR
jgi:RNA polymerase sigma-70 factor (ECF subfamily)